MRKASFAAAAIAFAALTGCGDRDEDQLDQTEINAAETGDLDILSNEAANIASEAEALENQAAELENQTQAVQDDAAGAETPADEDIQGM